MGKLSIEKQLKIKQMVDRLNGTIQSINAKLEQYEHLSETSRTMTLYLEEIVNFENVINNLKNQLETATLNLQRSKTEYSKTNSLRMIKRFKQSQGIQELKFQIENLNQQIKIKELEIELNRGKISELATSEYHMQNLQAKSVIKKQVREKIIKEYNPLASQLSPLSYSIKPLNPSTFTTLPLISYWQLPIEYEVYTNNQNNSTENENM